MNQQPIVQQSSYRTAMYSYETESVLSEVVIPPGYIIRKVEIDTSGPWLFAEILRTSERMSDILSGKAMYGAIQDASSFQKAETLAQIGIVLRKIHQFVDLPVKPYIFSIINRLLFLLNDDRALYREANISVDMVYSQFQKLADMKVLLKAGLCRIHGQYSLSSIVWKKGNIVGILDNKQVKFGSAYEDFASLALSLEDKEDLFYIAEGYKAEPHEKTLRAFMILSLLEAIHACKHGNKDSSAELKILKKILKTK